MAESAQQAQKLNVFISYSRHDLDFADQLRVALHGFGFGVTIDRDDIAGGDAWKKRLSDLIRDADTVVFVLSPSSADSPTCAWEVKEAVALGKRILPVICRALDGANPPPELVALNYIHFYPEPKFPGSGFGKGLVELASALNTDSGWLREHTRYLRLAKEWEEVGKPPDRRLLSAADIALAKTWAESRPTKAPEITSLQLDFINESEAADTRQKSAETQRQREIAEAQAARGEALEREAEAQKHEAEAQKREAEQAKRVARRTLTGLAAAVVLALAAAGFAFVAYQQRQTALQATATAETQKNNALEASRKADEQRKLAEQASNTAKKEQENAQKATQDAIAARQETQRQLDRANQALAESIENDLDLRSDEPLTTRQRQALWKLAVADEPVKRDFASILASKPEETIRVSRGLGQISRALGLLDASQVLDWVLKQIGQTTDPSALLPLAEAIQALPAELTEAQASQAVDPVLKQIGQTTDPDAFQAQAPEVLEAKAVIASAKLRARAEVLQALAAKLPEVQASQALDFVLEQISHEADVEMLQASAKTLQGLAAKLSEAQASQALDMVVKQIGSATKTYAFLPLAEALQALAAKLPEAQASHALNTVLDRTTDPDALRELTQAQAAKLTEAQASHALNTVLKQIGQTTDPSALSDLAEAIQALGPKLTEAQGSQALGNVLKQISQTTDPSALLPLAEAIQALPAKLTEPQASEALDPVLKQLGQTTDSESLGMLALALQALAAKLTEAQAEQASKAAAASLAWAANDNEAAGWARALVALAHPAVDRDRVLVAAIAYPIAAGSATEILLDTIRAAHPDAPTKEAGTEAALEWLAKTYPDVLRPPLCPQPLQPSLKCPLS